MTVTMTERAAQVRKLWVPNRRMELHDEYPVPTPERLREKWQQYVGEGTIESTSHIFGVLRKPDKQPRAYASIDLCEVVRYTHKSLRRVEEESPPASLDISNYAEGLSFGKEKGKPNPDVVSVVQVLMNNDLVPPVEDIKEIATIAKDLKEKGVYFIANTATLPGCEEATIDFFSQHMPGVFDALVLPRNHDGKDKNKTKGIAAKGVIELIHPGNEPIIAAKIDDCQHHLDSFEQEVGGLPNSTVATFRPEYPTQEEVENGRDRMNIRSLEEFKAMDIFFRNALANKEQAAA